LKIVNTKIQTPLEWDIVKFGHIPKYTRMQLAGDKHSRLFCKVINTEGPSLTKLKNQLNVLFDRDKHPSLFCRNIYKKGLLANSKLGRE